MGPFSSLSWPRFGTLVVLVAMLALVAGFTLASPAVTFGPLGGSGDEEPVRTTETVKFVRPAPDGESRMWPYTSRARTFDAATLPINVVVREDPENVRRLLVSQGALYWNENTSTWETDRHEEDSEASLNATDVTWGSSSGAARYTYIETQKGGGWTDAGYQLHDGTYFGTRHHLRFYEGRTENETWTAIQAHQEHWDWFRLRHTVDSLSRSQHYVERDLLETGLLSNLTRKRYANGGPVDHDGWVTVANLDRVVATGPGPGPNPGQQAAVGVPILGLVLAAAVRRQAAEGETASETRSHPGITRYHLALFASTALLLPAVRAAGIFIEQAYPGASPVLVGGPLYLVLIIGYPVAGTLFGRPLPIEEGFTAAIIGFGTGTMIDYAYLGIAALPYGAIVHRAILLVGLGLIAAGGSRWAENPLVRHRYRLVGLALWVGALLLPLIGL